MIVHYKLPLIILICILIATIAFRLISAAQKQLLTHDEGISYLAATCHQGSYNQAVQSTLVGNWVQASEWKQFIRPDQFFCFQRISFDLVHYDQHPPLYFWLLHVWVFIFGMNFWTGSSLNMLLAALTTLALIGLARTVLDNTREATLVVFTWAISPSIILISSEPRVYDLLTLCTVLLIWQIVRYARANKSIKPLEVLLLVILSTAGALTYYYFVFVMMGGILFLLVKLGHRAKYRFIVGAIAISAGHVFAVVLHPGFYAPIQRYNQYQPFIYDEFVKRIQVVLLSFSGFFYLFAILLGVIAWILITYFHNRPRLLMRLRQYNFSGFYILFFFAWLAGITIVLYLAFFSPQIAMGPKYLSMGWPFFAFLPVFLLRFSHRFRLYLTIFFYLCPLVLTTATLIDLNRKSHLSIPLEQADFVLIDNYARGILPRIIWHIPDDSLVLVDTQHHILSHPENWLDRLTDRSIYVSHLAYGNTLEQTKATLNLIDKNYDFTVVEQGIWDIGYIIKIETPNPP